MSSDKVIAEVAGMRADINAALEVMRADLSGLGARIDVLEATTATHLAAVDAQTAMLSWVMIAAFTILTAITTTGFFRIVGWWPRRDAASGQPMSGSSDQ